MNNYLNVAQANTPFDPTSEIVLPGQNGLSGGGFVINECDYRAVRELVLAAWTRDTESTRTTKDMLKKVQAIVEIHKDTDERRVSKLQWQKGSWDGVFRTGKVPMNSQLLQHTQQTKNYVYWRGVAPSPNWMHIASLPPSIGQLNKLELLDLSNTLNLSRLPKEIGNLTNLIKLKLNHSGIKSLPSSIGKLKNLDELNLAATKKLSKLPREIGKLASLTMLKLSGSGIKSLPRSLGKLLNLKELDVSLATNLRKLPDEISDLTDCLIKLQDVAIRRERF